MLPPFKGGHRVECLFGKEACTYLRVLSLIAVSSMKMSQPPLMFMR
jgi:hypothetical protein